MLHRNDAAGDGDSGRCAMKGMIFTEFLELVERTHSAELAETLVANADLPSGGIYTSVGNWCLHSADRPDNRWTRCFTGSGKTCL